jgi:hypothetical protein
MVRAGVCGGEESADRVAEWILKEFDLAPHGSLDKLKRAIAVMARAHGDEVQEPS